MSLDVDPFISKDTRILDNNYSLLKTLIKQKKKKRRVIINLGYEKESGTQAEAKGRRSTYLFTFPSNRQKIRCKITRVTMRGRSSPLRNVRALDDLESTSFDTVSGAFRECSRMPRA